MTVQKVDIKLSGEAIQACLEGPEARPLLITKDGKPYAAIVPLPDIDMESAALSLDPGFVEIIERSRRSLKEHGGIPQEEIEAEFAADRTAKPGRKTRRAS